MRVINQSGRTAKFTAIFQHLPGRSVKKALSRCCMSRPGFGTVTSRIVSQKCYHLSQLALSCISNALPTMEISNIKLVCWLFNFTIRVDLNYSWSMRILIREVFSSCLNRNPAILAESFRGFSSVPRIPLRKTLFPLLLIMQSFDAIWFKPLKCH
jgi:hypothetical protein